ncbi:MAG TPA: glycosyltransferase family 1 protein [Pyrinomonadaceae bacterium]|nr:glycosyltransferase family 1 protein [Pyrinomonadaceae bacterium]
MKIGVDATCWGNKRGYGRFTRELFEELLALDDQNQYLFFVDQKTARECSFPAAVETVIVETNQAPAEAASADGSRSMRDILAMSRGVLRHKLDIFFFPAVYSYFPIFNRTKVIVTLHDLIADNHPELIFPNPRARLFWKVKQDLAVRQASLIATVSEHSRMEIKRFFGLPDDRLRVIPEAARPIFHKIEHNDRSDSVSAKYGVGPSERFLLYVGGISPHKNLSTLIEAFAILETDQPDMKLVLVGDYKDDPFLSAYPRLKREVEEYRLGAKVIFTGYVPDEDLVYLYNLATLLVFPSFDEGFGLPAIEAMSCGTPVAASDRGSLPELLGDAGTYFDPGDARDLAAKVCAALSDQSKLDTMHHRGLKRSENFRWHNAARETLAIFDELGHKSPIYG